MTLLFAFPHAPVAADGGSDSSKASSVVEGVVTGITSDGKIITLLGGVGNLLIDVSSAKITGSGNDGSVESDASDLEAAARISVGTRIEADVTASAGSPPPPLMATFVVVKETRLVELSGMIQSVDVPNKTFTILFRTIHVDDKTQFGGESDKDKGKISGIGDLAAGMFADTSLTTSLPNVSSPYLLAVKVQARGDEKPPSSTVDFHGRVEKIASDVWTIDGKIVVITKDTKISGGPKVGDRVEVVAMVTTPSNTAMGMSSGLVAISIKKDAEDPLPAPLPLPGRQFEVEGRVQAISSPDPHSGIWKIDGQDVMVNGLTKIEGTIAIGDRVEVKGHVEIGAPSAGARTMAPLSMKLVADKIQKKSSGR